MKNYSRLAKSFLLDIQYPFQERLSLVDLDPRERHALKTVCANTHAVSYFFRHVSEEVQEKFETGGWGEASPMFLRRIIEEIILLKRNLAQVCQDFEEIFREITGEEIKIRPEHY